MKSQEKQISIVYAIYYENHSDNQKELLGVGSISPKHSDSEDNDVFDERISSNGKTESQVQKEKKLKEKQEKEELQNKFDLKKQDLKSIWYRMEESANKTLKESEDPETSKQDTEDEWIDYSSEDLDLLNLEEQEKSWILMKTVHGNMIGYADPDYMKDVQYQYQVYNSEQSAKESKTIKIKICKDRKCPNMIESEIYIHQESVYRGNMNKIEMNIMDQDMKKTMLIIADWVTLQRLYGKFPCTNIFRCEHAVIPYMHFRNAEKYEKILSQEELKEQIEELVEATI